MFTLRLCLVFRVSRLSLNRRRYVKNAPRDADPGPEPSADHLLNRVQQCQHGLTCKGTEAQLLTLSSKNVSSDPRFLSIKGDMLKHGSNVALQSPIPPPLPALSLRDPSPPHLSNFPTFLGCAPSVKGPIHGVNAAAGADRALRQDVWPIPCSA